jgi:serine/threonine-protein kinase
MEFVEGLSLRRHSNRFGDTGWVLEVLRQTAEGLAAVHAHGIVHRDLKPGNVLVTSIEGAAPLVKIADFGISSAPMSSETSLVTPTRAGAHEGLEATLTPPPSLITLETSSESGLTMTGVLMGTPKYMAPELSSGAKLAKPSSDIFSFGVIAYELLTGEAPFRDPPAVLRMQGLTSPPAPPVGQKCADLSPDLAALVDGCLSLEPDARPTAQELSVALAKGQLAIAQATLAGTS